MAKVMVENKLYKDWAEKLYNFLKGQRYGFSISWTELAGFIGQPNLEREKLYVIIDKVNNRLMFNEQMYLETISGFGKRIIEPKEHSEVSRKSVKSAVRKYRKAGRIIASTNVSELDDYQRRQIENDAMKWRTLELISSEMARKRVVNSKGDVKQDLVSDVIRLFSDEGKDDVD